MRYKILLKKIKIDFSTILKGRIKIGIGCDLCSSYIETGTYISENSIVRNTKVGKFCAIADNVRTVMGTHIAKEFGSIHPAFFN